MNFEEKIQKFIKFLQNNRKVKARFSNMKIINDTLFIRVIPNDLCIFDIPLIKKYCKILDLKCSSTFHSDIERSLGYRDYHDCLIADNGKFLEFNPEEIE